MTLKQVVEALIFASPKPLSTQEIVAALRSAGEKAAEGPERELAGADEELLLQTINELAEEIRTAARGFLLLEQVNGWALVTNPDCAPWVRRLYPEAKPARLSGPALETLAIIAYRQPVTRADVEAVRGVAVDGVMQVLLDRGLVRIAGRADVPGRPLLYATTEFFLQHFGLKTTDELPNASELKRIPLPTAAVAEEKPEASGQKPDDRAAEASAGETSSSSSSSSSNPPEQVPTPEPDQPGHPDQSDEPTQPEPEIQESTNPPIHSAADTPPKEP